MEALSSKHQYIENATRSLFVENTTLTRNALCWDFSSLKCEESTFWIANLTNYVKHIHFLMSQQSPCKKEILQIFFADNYDATMLLFSDVRAMKSIPVHPDKMQIELA